MKEDRPELMGPIKNKSSLKACKPYVDSVYFSTTGLSLRTGADNIKREELSRFVESCHKEDISAYLTVNSVIYEREMDQLENVLEAARKAEVDAVIVWDPAAIRVAKKKNLDFYISTQASVSNSEAANFYESVGAKRVIAARELSLDQIKKIKEKAGVELEVFVHGAMCLAISGRCILSGYFENKSANKGACNQLCRRKWFLLDEDENKIQTDGKHYLSPKDLCMVEYIPELIESGVDAFKIEGRQRSNRYIELTTEIYRKAINAYFEGVFTKNKAKKWKKRLQKVYNRGFTTGFYFGSPGPEGIQFESSGNAGSMKRLQVGEVVNYFSEVEVASVDLLHRGLEIGEEILIEGKNTYLRQEIKSMEKENEGVQKAEKEEKVGVKVNGKVRPGDKVFKLVE